MATMAGCRRVPEVVNPSVSIVMPAYNAASFIGESIASVREQTFRDWRLIIVDDGSVDSTYERATSAAESDSRIQVIRKSRNEGVSAARQTALDMAEGTYVAFLDADDWWLPEKLELQVDFQSRTGFPLTFTRMRRVSADGRRVGRLIRIPQRLTYRELLGNTAIVTSSAMVERRCLEGLRMTDGYGYDDFILWLDILRNGAVAGGIDADLVRYRVLENSVSRNKVRSAMRVWRIYRTHERLGLVSASGHFLQYVTNAIFKYARF